MGGEEGYINPASRLRKSPHLYANIQKMKKEVQGGLGLA
jgi:hypothetical protein